jgi:peptide/nickel transport system substrate-binding protein
MPGGGDELVFRFAERSESEQGPAIRDFVTGYLAEIGIGTEVSVFDDTQLTDVIGSGEYDLFSWGWTPFVDPDPMLSYFTCAQVTTDMESIGYNDANWCDPRYDELYAQQNVELDRDRRIEIVHEMLELFYHESTYVVLYEDADTQAYRTDRFEGWLQQPTETGPVLFSNSSPTYVNLRPVDGGDDDDGGGLGAAFLIAVAAGVVVIGGAGVWAVRSRKSRDDRE